MGFAEDNYTVSGYVADKDIVDHVWNQSQLANSGGNLEGVPGDDEKFH